MKSFLSALFTLLCFQFAFSQWINVGPYNPIMATIPDPLGKPIDIAFTNDSTGVCSFERIGAGSGGKWLLIMQTNDYGKNWNQTYYWNAMGITGVGGRFQHITGDTILYVNETNVPFSNCYISYNGGLNWANYFANQRLSSFYFPVAQHGNFIDENNIFAKRRASVTSTLSIFTGTLNATKSLWMNSYNKGFIIHQNNNLLTTIDSGYSWTTVLSKTFNLNSIYFVSNNIGFIACDSGKVLKTINSGLNWTEINTGYFNKLNSISFKNDTIGYCVGNNGLIIKTVNGGLSWKKETIATSQNIIRVVALNKKAYVLASDDRVFSIDLDTCLVRPTVSLTSSTSFICHENPNGSTVTLNGTPTGGTYYGSNLNGNIFSTSNITNMYYFHYTFIDLVTGCASTAKTNIMTVQNTLNAFITPSQNSTCINSAFGNQITLSATPSGGVFSGAGVVGNTFTPSNNAGTYLISYSVVTTNNCISNATTNIVVESCVGISELNPADEIITIFPNPTTALLNIKLNSFEADVKLILHNSVGQELIIKEVKNIEETIDLSFLKSGIYFLSVISNKTNSLTYKVIRE